VVAKGCFLSKQVHFRPDSIGEKSGFRVSNVPKLEARKFLLWDSTKNSHFADIFLLQNASSYKISA